MSKNRFETVNGNVNILRDDWKQCAQVTYYFMIADDAGIIVINRCC